MTAGVCVCVWEGGLSIVLLPWPHPNILSIWVSLRVLDQILIVIFPSYLIITSET